MSITLRPQFKHRLMILLLLFILCMAILFFIAWYGRLPANSAKPSTYQIAVSQTKQGTKVSNDLPPSTPSSRFQSLGSQSLANGIADLVKANPNKTGVYPLNNGMDAFAARMLLIMTAEKTLDLQYYIWNNDITGNLMFQAIKDAADRGVRVRLLLDDNNTRGLDPTLWLLDKHPNIEVRLMNPNTYRAWRWLGFVGDFKRLNHRMHNKSITADSQISITGGRNIGDEYFSLNQQTVFSDLDIMTVGNVVPQISQDFDRYWNHRLAFPLTDMVNQPEQAALNKVFTPSTQKTDKTSSQQLDPVLTMKDAYLKRIVALDFVNQIKQQRLKLYWTTTDFISDDPDKLLGEPSNKIQRIVDSLGNTQRHLNLVSAYFVPTQGGVDYFVGLAKKGVDIKVLTNAMSATDVKVVHAGYAKHRKQLIENGIKLYEMKPNAVKDQLRDSYLTGNSGTSLHAKTFESDGERIYIGSFNFDPRSASLNTEMGITIHSPAMAQYMAHDYEKSLPTSSYAVTLNGDNLQWQTIENGKPVTYTEEPHTKSWERTVVWMLSHLPIDWLL